ncbi:hypothetical protein F4780DRAFT_79639 [Xylariomycetidae sp. FL0641]|nr:hypothetical protein F4780DRAFT_79639 [Xylariomycetidae sp. FL0641]
MAPTLGPRIRRTAQNTQYTYNTDRRIHTVRSYPVLSPQGATILIYGHENGATILWRGGRRFKAAVEEKGSKNQQNGKQDAIMILDSDEDDGAGNPTVFVDKPEFEEDLDEDQPYPEITQTLDLEFGTAVLHLATPPITPCSAEDAVWEGSGILKEKIVFAASCAARGVYLVTLPLVPPSPLSKAREDLQTSLLAGKAGNGKWGETLTLLTGQRKPCDSLALSLIRTKSSSERGKSTERSRSASKAAPRAVVAASSSEASGTLRLWDVPIDTKGKSTQQVEPFQTEFLPRPLRSVSFNPTQPTQVLCNASPDAVRVYDYAVASMPPDDLSEGPFPSQGSWVLSLLPPFARPSPTRKPILAAEWVANGRAVLVLLADGQWGIWDVEGASPVRSTLFGPQASNLRGTQVCQFSVSGYVEGTSPLRNLGSQRVSASAEFLPMTPHQRRDAISGASYGPERLATVKGGITVTPLPTSATSAADESVTLWIGGAEHVFVIPRLMKFWDAQIHKGSGGGVNLFSGAQPTRMVRLSDLVVGLMGERCTGVCPIVKFAETGGMSEAVGEGLPVDVMVCGESRVVVIRESETAPGTRIGGVVGRRKRLGDRARENTAIIVHPRPQQPGSIAYNLSVGPRRPLAKPGFTGLFDKPSPPAEEEQMQVDPEPAASTALPARTRYGFSFLDKLNAAADVEPPEDEDEENERDIEVEMLDIMEIDRELDAMNDGRGRGRKKVVFDS